jgi:aspartate racemase
VDFAEIEQLQRNHRWDEAGLALAAVARSLQAAGAECIVLCTNTMHTVAASIEGAVSIPLLHIADATGDALRKAGIDSIGLLGTRFTMEQPFYCERLRERHGLRVVVPDADDRDTVHRVIYDELVHGRVVDASRVAYLEIVERMQQRGAQAVVLGCTEIGLLIGPGTLALPCFDTTVLHSAAAVEWALS